MKDADLLRIARERYDEGIKGDQENRDRDLEQRKFYRGKQEDQWAATDLTKRKNRISVTVNRCPQFVKQITGEMRQNKPAIRVLPVDDQTDPKLAEVYSAIIRHIESNSKAHRVYTKAAEQAVIGGIGWFRILTDWEPAPSFRQEILIKHIRNPLAVVYDPGAVELTRKDMMWAFVSELIPEDAFKAAYPKAKLQGFDGPDFANWRTADKKIRVAEYWTREEYTRDLLLLSDGSTRYGDELTEEAMAAMDAAGITIANQRKAKAYKVKCRKMSGLEVLETYDWVGSCIPLIPVIGEEVEVGDEVFRHGMVYPMMDPQRGYNFASSAMYEATASQPKAPYLVTTKMVANHKKSWDGLNDGNPSVLPYDPDPLAPQGPQRIAPPNFSSAWFQLAQVADGDMKATTGIYDASLGERSNETSGVAIRARDQQGETGSYVYVDNQAASIEHCGEILLEVIPEIITGEHVVRMMGEDGAIEGYEQVNTMLPDGTVWNDISIGQFDLEVVVGPSFATKRQQAAETIMALSQAMPEQMAVAADLLVKSQDIPYGDKIAERIAMQFTPPGMDEDIDKKRMEMQQRAQAMQPQQPDPMQEIAVAGAMEEVKNKAADTRKKEAETAKIAVQTEQEAQELVLGPLERGQRFGGAGNGANGRTPSQA